MTRSLSRRLVIAFGTTTALLWSLCIGLAYSLMVATDDLWRWANALVPVPPDMAQGLQVIGTWLAQFGSWLLLIVWAIGLAVVLLLSMLARTFTNLLEDFQREGRLSSGMANRPSSRTSPSGRVDEVA